VTNRLGSELAPLGGLSFLLCCFVRAYGRAFILSPLRGLISLPPCLSSRIVGAVPAGLGSLSYLPGTYVPGFHIPPLRGWRIAGPLLPV
jgi:hypothetical protein